MMKSVADLDLGALDAITYQTRKEKGFLSRVFLQDENLTAILKDKTYFLIGEKGSGKTAYSTFISNNNPDNNRGHLVNIAKTDYEDFLAIQSDGFLKVSSIKDCWKVILLLLCGEKIKDKEVNNLSVFPKFNQLNDAIEKYYDSAFDPEVVNAIDLIKNSEEFAEILAKFEGLGAKVGEVITSEVRQTERRFVSRLRKIEKSFKDAISSLKLKNDHIIFIDGIDVRPSDIEYEQYVKCVSGLAHAVWELNTQFFADIRDSKGRIRVVILLRPDIFDAVNFQNANGKLRDNGVFLKWVTTYDSYKDSKLFKLIDKLLARQDGHPEMEEGAAWARYFPFEVLNQRIAENFDDPFIALLRTSFYRPRDIISYLQIMQDQVKLKNPDAINFSEADLRDCRQEYSDYLLGEIKDYMSFYYSPSAFEQFHGFFNYLKGVSKFSWGVFDDAYREYFLENRDEITIDRIKRGSREFAQFLYEMNVIGYAEEAREGVGRFIHWHFRDSTQAKLTPQIPFGLEKADSYHIHGGLVRALKVGTER